jgi:serine/threonine protein kinase
MKQDAIINFLRKKDYKFVRELGQGACGLTVLLHDEQIGENFVCKKYTPYNEVMRIELYNNFVREVKLLHKILHPNVVRVFNSYLYPDICSGYILMEHVDGVDIEDALDVSPERVDELFLQAIDGFEYLESIRILHRDIRVQNILVTKDGVLKIIDLGFGKRVEVPEDFDKSISLNLWCPAPSEFSESKYDFTTEVYFLGKLFEKIIIELKIDSFSYHSVLQRMCQNSRASRFSGFAEINREIQGNRFTEIEFSDSDLHSYREFSKAVINHVTKIERGAKYKNDFIVIKNDLETAYRAVMLEEMAPDCGQILRALIDGSFYLQRLYFPVSALKGFVRLIKSSNAEQARIILANLHMALGSIKRYDLTSDDDILPF